MEQLHVHELLRRLQRQRVLHMQTWDQTMVSATKQNAVWDFLQDPGSVVLLMPETTEVELDQLFYRQWEQLGTEWIVPVRVPLLTGADRISAAMLDVFGVEEDLPLMGKLFLIDARAFPWNINATAILGGIRHCDDRFIVSCHAEDVAELKTRLDPFDGVLQFPSERVQVAAV